MQSWSTKTPLRNLKISAPSLSHAALEPITVVVPRKRQADPHAFFERAAEYRLGSLKGCLKVPDDFDRMGEDEIVDLFEGKYSER